MKMTTIINNNNENHDEYSNDYSKTYPDKFFSLFGSLKDYDIEEPKEIPFEYDRREEL